MSHSQRRSGPMNVGYYGLAAPFINAFSLIISTVQYPKSAVMMLLLLLALLCIILLFALAILIHPLFNIDIGLSFIMFILVHSLMELLLIMGSISSSSKYAIIGSIRIVGIIVAFELIVSCSILVIIITYYCIELSFSFLFLFSSADITMPNHYP